MVLATRYTFYLPRQLLLQPAVYFLKIRDLKTSSHPFQLQGTKNKLVLGIDIVALRTVKIANRIEHLNIGINTRIETFTFCFNGTITSPDRFFQRLQAANTTGYGLVGSTRIPVNTSPDTLLLVHGGLVE